MSERGTKRKRTEVDADEKKEEELVEPSTHRCRLSITTSAPLSFAASSSNRQYLEQLQQCNRVDGGSNGDLGGKGEGTRAERGAVGTRLPLSLPQLLFRPLLSF